MELPSLASMAILLYLLHLTFASPESPPLPSADQFVSCLPNHFANSSNPISDVIYTRQDPSFSSILQAYIKNSRFNRSTTPKPLVIVTANDYSHVQSVVVCAKISGVELRIRSGGHDYEGMSYVSRAPFVVLDMSNLRTVQVDVKNEVAWVQAGAILGELYYKAAKESNNTLAFTAGVCPTVGVGGHICGGGHGVLIRKYGLSVDNVLDVLVVDAKGNILNRDSMGEDFFWAIRGGGAASFCVILAWKIHLVRVPQTVTVFGVTKTLEQGATDMIDQWQRVAYMVDPNLFLRAQAQAINGSGGNKTTLGVTFLALYLGGAKDLVPLVNKNFPLLGLEMKDCVEMSWPESIMYWQSGFPTLGTPIEQMLARNSSSSVYFKNKSDYVKKPIPTKGWEAIWEKLIELGPNVFVPFSPFGGRISEIADDASPFPHRSGTIIEIQYVALWNDTDVKTEEMYLRGMRELQYTLAPYVSANPRGAYLNFRDIDIGTNANGDLGFAMAYFKGNLMRLQRVKAKVDPENFFSYEQSIPKTSGC